jgi:hypothetical protein
MYIYLPKPCRGYVDLSLKTNHTRFKGLKLHIHLLESELSISLNLSLQRWLIKDKMLSSSLGRMRYKHVMRIEDPYRGDVSKLSGGGWNL